MNPPMDTQSPSRPTRELGTLLGCRSPEDLARALALDLAERWSARLGLLAVCPDETRDWTAWSLHSLEPEPWSANHPLVEEFREEMDGAVRSLDPTGLDCLRADGSPRGTLRGVALRDGRMGLLGALALCVPAGTDAVEQREIEAWLRETALLSTLLLERLVLGQRLEHLEREVDELESLKSSFMDTVSHELKTPLTSILGFSSLALDQPSLDAHPPLPEFLRSIHDAALQLDRLISEVLVMSEMASAEGILELEDRSLGSLLSEYREGWLNRLSGGERVRFPDNALECMVRVDPYQFHRILSHLLKNALGFSPEASEVTVSCAFISGRRRSDSTDFLRIDVVDRGAGIPLEEQERIFRKFYQVDRSSTREHGGAGLGLTVAKEFTEAMGGRLWLRSEPGRGSTFSFTVPVPRDGGLCPPNEGDGSAQ